jgi:IS5 family transposase
MSYQPSFADLELASKKKRTRRERFLDEMEQVVPWSRLLGVLRPRYYRDGRRGQRPKALEMMLRVYLMQNWFGLSDPGMEDALYEVASMRRFAGLNLDDDAIPDETTLVRFRHWLEAHDLTEKLFAEVNAVLEANNLAVSSGTMVDATIVPASPSTKNKARQRDPEMHQTRKGNQWYFGMKIHVGADVDSGAAHHVTVTAANRADVSELDNLLRDTDTATFGDSGYAGDKRKRQAREAGHHWCVNDKRKPGRSLSSSQRKRNRRYSSVRARIEHLFRIIKCQFGYRKARYRGLKKNRAQVMSLMALANLYLLRRRLMA